LAVQNRLMKAAGFRKVDAEPRGLVLGITGGSGCGKTTLLKAFESIGGFVEDCDWIYHMLLREDKSLLAAIENRFPGCVENGTLNRKKLAGIVFTDPAALADLNAITHGAVKKEVVRRLENTPGGVPVAIDAIGLFEGGLGALCDVTVAVTAPLEDRVQRLIRRDNITREQALQRINAQKPESYFREKCDYVLENDGTAEEFREKCIVLFQKLSIIKKD